jgi:hypothetical protein
MSGSRTIMADPKQTSTGPVNEDITYSFTATNACGGTTTKTAMLHVVGSIDPPPTATLVSLFYPTAYPTKTHPKVGLLPSEKEILMNLATQFKNFGMYERKASLVIVGYADVRGARKYNQALSERRAALVRDYLISKGVPADEIGIRAVGKDQQIDLKKVEAFQSKDEQKPEKWMTKDKKTTWLAYNRRADIILEPTAQQSIKMYPNEAADAQLLWQRHEPTLKAVDMASKTSTGVSQARASDSGN